MANTSISNLTAGGAVAGTDLVPSVQVVGVGPVKVTATQIKTFIVGAGSVSVASGKTLTVNNTLTLSGTDGTTMTFPSTSATLAGLGIANVFTQPQTFQPSIDGQAGTFRRLNGTQTSNILELQTEANAFLAGFDKSGLLTLGAASTQTGILKMAGTTSGTVSLSVADAAGTWTMKLPNSGGTNGFILTTDGSGNTSWTNPTALGIDLDVGSTAITNGTTGRLLYDNAGTLGEALLTYSAATLQLGAADAAAPVAQTFKVQSGTAGASATTVSISGTSLTIAGTVTGTIAIGHAVTGTGVSAGTLITAGSGTSWTVNNSQTVGPITAYFNSVGANFTIQGSQGSGPSAGGSLIFQVAPAGSAATTAQNAYATALTLNSSQQAVIQSAGTAALPSLTWSNDATTGFYKSSTTIVDLSIAGTPSFRFSTNGFFFATSVGRIVASSAGTFSFSSGTAGTAGEDVYLYRDNSNILALRNGTNAQTFNVYGSYTSTTNYQRVVVKTLREVSSALSGATYVSTIAIPAYAVLIGVTTRVTTAVTGATSYDVGDGTNADLWGAAIGVTLGSQSRTADFTDVAATGAAATSRTVTLTANGSNFTGGVVEICLHYLTTEAD